MIPSFYVGSVLIYEFLNFSALAHLGIPLYFMCFVTGITNRRRDIFRARRGSGFGLVSHLLWLHLSLATKRFFPGDKAWCLLFLFSGEGLRTKLDISHFPFRFFLLTSVLPTYIWTVFLLAERFSGYFWCVHSLFSLLLRAFAFFDI
ncbi:uncharacterized protein BO96DRAFT_231096 [Aspergillus niger CBS 101883]|uniref:Uncharacterized protein n=1 Tax=Aspergillus niger ATCC 13496 TaxID=1353008 RepID=A0A370BUL7_ASPNG|nr:uncharacterized protein BO96DRAFT_231096 [Aspergillus niger CBS 101883]PYH58986.1 hypothetical protein BO96DRAFT_231096 [Aspergillus niger CBS 101883]RDH19206.1 hypothetical protein M747DRAFT_67602 [Aspergillus niger ATCC 13496]